jgi:hypothetical protein
MFDRPIAAIGLRDRGMDKPTFPVSRISKRRSSSSPRPPADGVFKGLYKGGARGEQKRRDKGINLLLKRVGQKNKFFSAIEHLSSTNYNRDLYMAGFPIPNYPSQLILKRKNT